ncbi:hypothetical protein PENARI_c034G06324 [Penicillium arizonense]|uniref:Uncharacterized protein n=1 Tax=Penicillium arizonense TaxID=1835702 RepID=A0A1F5L422_PENAI|nr:hypothetical protein PENARI_c034G06324 [Penicillium arizonense]OGE47965.1 hypothetical protein PENARI_c034G06324 [Penicillium arizonense]
MVAAEIYSKVYDTKVLTTISVKMIDEDPEVRDFKVSILDQVNVKYGPEQAAELRNEKKYIELENRICDFSCLRLV